MTDCLGEHLWLKSRDHGPFGWVLLTDRFMIEFCLMPGPVMHNKGSIAKRKLLPKCRDSSQLYSRLMVFPQEASSWLTESRFFLLLRVGQAYRFELRVWAGEDVAETLRRTQSHVRPPCRSL